MIMLRFRFNEVWDLFEYLILTKTMGENSN